MLGAVEIFGTISDACFFLRKVIRFLLPSSLHTTDEDTTGQEYCAPLGPLDNLIFTRKNEELQQGPNNPATTAERIFKAAIECHKSKPGHSCFWHADGFSPG
jgi:hypothetical protein